MLQKQEVMQYVEEYVPKRIFGVLFVARELNKNWGFYIFVNCNLWIPLRENVQYFVVSMHWYRTVKVQKQITIRRCWPGLIIEASFKIVSFETH